MQLDFNTISEPGIPGLKWKKMFDSFWPEYLPWFTASNNAFTPNLHTSQAALLKYMPKMWPIYQYLCNLTNHDPIVARFLTGFQPPIYKSGCSQAVTNDKIIQLIRNYDYHPDLIEGAILLSSWNGKKVIASSDSLIGVLDGMNENGLAVSLTFGGRSIVGYGFGIPFILRYILEFCNTVDEAVATLISIPSHMAFNVTLVDKSGAYKTVLVAPDCAPIITDVAFTTNHQQTIECQKDALFNKTVERSIYLNKLLSEKHISEYKISDTFLQTPLYTTLFEQGFGTLYTAVYYPTTGTVRYRWQNDEILVDFNNFHEVHKSIKLKQIAHF